MRSSTFVLALEVSTRTPLRVSRVRAMILERRSFRDGSCPSHLLRKIPLVESLHRERAPTKSEEDHQVAHDTRLIRSVGFESYVAVRLMLMACSRSFS